MICLFVKLDMCVWCRRIVLSLVFLNLVFFFDLVFVAPTGFVVQYQCHVRLVQSGVCDMLGAIPSGTVLI